MAKQVRNWKARKAAKAKDLKRYRTKTPCVRGHIAERLVSNGACCECHLEDVQNYFASKGGRATLKRHRVKHRDKRNKASREWRAANPEKHSEMCQAWRDANSDYRIKEYETKAKLMAENVQYRMAAYLRRRINSAIRKRQKGGSAVHDLGCSIEFLIGYLEGKFKNGMTWKNWGPIWELDHVTPLGLYDLTKRSDFLLACSYKNLQPLSLEDHKIKTARDRELIAIQRGEDHG